MSSFGRTVVDKLPSTLTSLSLNLNFWKNGFDLKRLTNLLSLKILCEKLITSTFEWNLPTSLLSLELSGQIQINNISNLPSKLTKLLTLDTRNTMDVSSTLTNLRILGIRQLLWTNIDNFPTTLRALYIETAVISAYQHIPTHIHKLSILICSIHDKMSPLESLSRIGFTDHITSLSLMCRYFNFKEVIQYFPKKLYTLELIECNIDTPTLTSIVYMSRTFYETFYFMKDILSTPIIQTIRRLILVKCKTEHKITSDDISPIVSFSVYY